MSKAKTGKLALRSCFLLLLGLLMLLPYATAFADNQAPPAPPVSAPVAVIPVHQTIETGLQKFLERAIREAEDSSVVCIILDIDTLGGRVDSAEEIGELIKGSKVPTVAYVHGRAVSAGSYIALNANQIVMEPGSTIGAAAVVDAGGNEVESVKVIAHWASQMRSAAELRGRDPQIAEAMVDKNVGVDMKAINRTVPKGQLVSLTAEEAVKVGYAEATASNMQEVIGFIKAADHPVLNIEPSLAEKFSRFLTQPWVSMLLLFLGIAGIAIELFVPGFGLPGIIGLLGFGLYFFGHYIVGFAGVEDIALFIIGVVLLVIEIFVSSFGILGLIGIACLFSSVVMAAYNTKQAALHLSVAFVLAVIVVGIFIWIFKDRGVWNRFILKEELRSEKGYNSVPIRTDLVGKSGTSITPLRPAGTIYIGDERIDVVTSGEFIAVGKQVVIVQVDGARIVVREAGGTMH
ncbi:nodulation protein NfeD [Paenibacillus doosanensis]|uniref:NfeD family protein n=1 Tax=Paenibacillus doosanensis TaxID=1229154 RepID=UPI00217FA467|nr:nodulation protein NfeD [Paenibacillus doosanensis]MCS7463470.1 nodulation protein NfeD [Paenibacillus doosanensis]